MYSALEESFSQRFPDGHPCMRYYPDLCISMTDLFIIRAADYNCRLPANTSPTKIFMLTAIGVFIPLAFVYILGAILMTVPAYVLAYENGDAAGVLSKGAIYHSPTGRKVC